MCSREVPKMSNQNDDNDFYADFVLTPFQARRNRIKWGKDLLKAKKIVYIVKNGVKELKLIYTQTVDFEF
jgi:hypothetical protein